MKQFRVRLPDPLAYRFKLLCVKIQVTQQEAMQKMIEQFVKDNETKTKDK